MVHANLRFRAVTGLSLSGEPGPLPAEVAALVSQARTSGQDQTQTVQSGSRNFVVEACLVGGAHATRKEVVLVVREIEA